MKRKRRELMSISFDNYIWACFLEFLQENEIETDNGRELKEGVQFDSGDTKNRNTIVPDQLWKEILFRHLYRFPYN